MQWLLRPRGLAIAAIGGALILAAGACVWGGLVFLKAEVGESLADALRTVLRESPAARREIGAAQEVQIDFDRSRETRESLPEKQTLRVFHVRGDRGRAEARLITEETPAGRVFLVELHLPTGRVVSVASIEARPNETFTAAVRRSRSDARKNQ